VNNNRKLPFIIIGAIVFVIAALATFASGGHKDKNTVTLAMSYGALDTSDMTVILDGDNSPAQALYQVPAGTHAVTVKKPGYKDFKVTVPTNSNQYYVINPTLQREAVAEIKSAADLALPKGIPADKVSITHTEYFFDKNWAVSTITLAGTDTALVVNEYDGGNKNWFLVAGPGTLFDSASLAGVPQEIQTYIQSKGYTASEELQ
jgi:hypothetical protein